MNPDQIKKLLGNKIYRRAMDYYNEGAVQDIESKGSKIWALVEGSYDTPYEIYIDQDRLIYQCNCPYGGLCKHIGAVLLELFFDYPKKRRTPYTVKSKLEMINEIKEQIDTPSTKIIHLTKSMPNPENQTFSPTEPQGKNSSQKYRLIFTIYAKPMNNNIHGLVISPALQYIKKDGTGGRIEGYSDRKLSQAPSPTEYKLFSSLRVFRNYQAPLSIIAPFIESTDNMNITLATRGYYNDVKFIPLEKIKISYTFMGMLEEEAVFQPNIIINPGDESDEILSSQDLFVELLNVFVAGENKIYYCFNNINLAMFMYKFFLGKDYFTFSSIKNIQEEADRNLSEYFTFDFNLEKIKFKYMLPEPVIEINRKTMVLDITLLFRYSGKPVNYMKDEKLVILIDESTDSEIAVAPRNYEYESLYIELFEEHFEKSKQKLIELPRLSFFSEQEENQYMYSGDFYSFLDNHAEKLIEKGFELRLKEENTPIRASSMRVTSEITSGIDWFEVNTKLTDKEGKSESFKIDPHLLSMGLAKSSGGYTLLKKDDIDYLMRLSQEYSDSDGNIKVNSLDFDIIEQIYTKAVGEVPNDVRKIHEIYEKLKNFKKIKSYPNPRNFGTKLRKYQKAGYNWLHFLRQHDLNGCLADDMGLGKTVQALALLQKLKEEKELKTSLVVVPVTTLPNWENEINRFTQGITYTIHMGQGRLKEKETLLGYDLVLTSYHTLRNDIELFSEMKFFYLILDESHYIKNSTSKAFKAVRSLNAAHRLGLSGTPIENNTMELWSQMDFLNPGLLGNRKEFSRKFAKPIEKQNNSAVAEKLKKLVYPFILRRKKEEVATDLPEKEEIILYCDMDSKQRKLYEGFKETIRSEITETIDKKGKDSSSIEIFAALTRLRQMALFPSLISEKYKKIESGKLERFKELVDEILSEDHKVLVFSQFVTVLSIIKEHLASKGIDYSYIDGSTQKRAQEIKKFQDNDDCPIFLLSIKAGGVGINLTAADYVLIFDPWWNPAVESQAIDRAYRIGQTRKVIAYKIITKNSIEEKMIELQNRKKKLVNDIITEDSSFFKNMSRDDIIGLFD